MVRVARTVTPDPARHAAYRALFERGYARLYPALRPIFHDSAAAAAAAAAATAVTTGADAPAAVVATIQAAQGQAAAAEPSLPRVIVAPSILAADFAALGDEAARCLAAGADWLHVDMFDGGDLSGGNWTLGPPVVAALRRRAPGAFLDCHLAVADPARFVGALAAAGASSVTFQIEAFLGGSGGSGENGSSEQQQQSAALEAAAALAADIRSRGMRAAVAVAVDTPVEAALPLARAGAVDMLLVMSVRSGFGGQRFDGRALGKLAAARAACPRLPLQVDGGVTAETAAQAAAAGANVFVAGTAVFGAHDLAGAIAAIRGAALAELPAALAKAMAGSAAAAAGDGGAQEVAAAAVV